MASKILLFIGSGANIGASTVKTFLAAGYKVAQASRSLKPEDSTEDNLHLVVDATKPESITKAFEETRKKLGEPNVVIYNAAAAHFGGGADTLNHVSLSDFTTDLTINTTSPFVAAQEALKSFNTLPSATRKTFFFTGNLLNEQKAIPGLLTLGVGKSATAYLIAEADLVYRKQGIRFHYVDERTEVGGPIYNGVSGEGHANFFLALAEGGKGDEVPWQATFVSGKGYVEFPIRGVEF
ncbi:hypothetical protein CBER1_09460 [Cercospora berteroae]|uniref:NAD(P)-binding domain-containing protein n=1 Tax=Cercospora berteroae TaxID=357750 RepID=A0A2S6CNP3_9PEZI|nr:hypothetical protein CBER1_09460 [Cercospora berteroae]